ncbi:MAG: transglutaminase domain-containing protein [Bacilli bacterium]
MRHILGVFILLLTLLFSGCAHFEEKTKNNATPKMENTLYNLKKRYGENRQTISSPLYNINETETLRFRFLSDLSQVSANEIVSVHSERNCLPESDIGAGSPFASEYKDGFFIFNVEPPLRPVLASPTEKTREGRNWGNAPVYYIRINYDLQSITPKKLDKPIIIPMTISSNVTVPTVKIVSSGNGNEQLYWKPIKNASKYVVYKIENTTSTNLKGKERAYRGFFANKYAALTTNYFPIKYNASDGNSIEFVVTAIVGGKESRFSQSVSVKQTNHPVLSPINKVETFADAPFTVQSETNKSLNRVYYDMGTLKITDNGGAQILFSVDGWPGSKTLKVRHYKTGDEQILPTVPVSKKGFIEVRNNMDDFPIRSLQYEDKRENVFEVTKLVDEIKQEVDHAETIEVAKVAQSFTIFADSAFEEYVAESLLAGRKNISLQAFPSYQDTETIADQMFKVIYQNPYILNVESFDYDFSTKTIQIKYIGSYKEIKKKQMEIARKTTKIISEIIEEKQSEVEKVRSIYTFLERESDFEEGQSPKEEIVQTKKEQFEYNSTYGIMVKKKGTSLSYAQTFKLLSAKIGIENIVVTGQLNHSIHAWNKVKIDGKWFNIDVTNNKKNTNIPYMLFLTSDSWAKSMAYIEDQKYEIDNRQQLYKSISNEYGWYASNNVTTLTPSEIEDTIRTAMKNDEPSCVFYIPIEVFSKPNRKNILFQMNTLLENIDTISYSISGNFLVINLKVS